MSRPPPPTPMFESSSKEPIMGYILLIHTPYQSFDQPRVVIIRFKFLGPTILTSDKIIASMSSTATASLRPLGSQCLQASRLGVISLTLQSRSSSLNVRAVVSLPQQRRLYSDQQDGNHNEGRRQPPMPKLTFRQFLGRVLTVSFRNAAHVSNKQKIRTFFRGNPVAFAALIVL